MRILFLLCIIFLGLFLQRTNAQTIMNGGYPSWINDWIYMDNISLRLETQSNCHQTRIVIENKDTSYYQPITSYIWDGKFDVEGSKWIALFNTSPGDDFGGNYLTCLYVDSNGDIVEKNNEQGIEDIGHFVDFTIYNEDSILLIKKKRYSEKEYTLEIYDFDLNLQRQIIVPKEYQFIDFELGQIYAFTKNGIDQYSLDFELLNSIELPKEIINYHWNDKQLYVNVSDEILLLHFSLYSLGNIKIKEDAEITDISFQNDSLLLIDISEPHTSTIYWYLDEEKKGVVNSEKFKHQYFTRFAKGGENELIYGRQVISNDYRDIINSGIYSSISNLNQETYDYEIALNELDTEQTVRGEIIRENGDTILLYNYELSFSYTVSNLGEDTLNNARIVSEVHGGSNCNKFFYQYRLKDDPMLPGESRIIEGSIFRSTKPNKELCLYLITTNDYYDTNFSNNITCQQVVLGVDESSIGNTIYLYPNPTKDILYLEMDNLISRGELTITDLLGRTVIHIPYQEKVPIDVSELNEGWFLLTIYNKDGLLGQEAFFK